MEKQIVLIDMFSVPEAAVPEFLEAAGKLPPLLRTLPGYVEGWIFQSREADSRVNVVTTAVWEDAAAFDNAKARAQEACKRINFDPQEVIARLNVTMTRATYQRAPY